MDDERIGREGREGREYMIFWGVEGSWGETSRGGNKVWKEIGKEIEKRNIEGSGKS